MSLLCWHSCMASYFPHKEIQSLYLDYKALVTDPSSCPPTLSAQAFLFFTNTISSSGPLHMMVSMPRTLSPVLTPWLHLGLCSDVISLVPSPSPTASLFSFSPTRSKPLFSYLLYPKHLECCLALIGHSMTIHWRAWMKEQKKCQKKGTIQLLLEKWYVG